MTTVQVDPGVCGFTTNVEAVSEDQEEVKITVKTGCESVRKMMEELGDTFDQIADYVYSMDKRPGQGPLFEFAGEHFPIHAACPVIAGIIKCAEVECKLALPKDAQIKFI